MQVVFKLTISLDASSMPMLSSVELSAALTAVMAKIVIIKIVKIFVSLFKLYFQNICIIIFG